MHTPFAVLSAVCLALALSLVSLPASAVPDELDYQAYLSLADGSPVDGNVSITFAAYTTAVGGVPLWTQTINVPVDTGLFTVALGGAPAPFPANMFNTDLYIGLFVAGEEMLPRRKLRTTAFAFKADDADTVGGMTAASLDQSADIAAVTGDVSALDGRVGTLELTDITNVAAVGGLTGGGSSGNVNIGIAPAGVTNDKLAANSVGTANIADNQVTSADIQNGGVTLVDMGPNSVSAVQLLPGAVVAGKIAANAVGTSEVANESLTAADLGADSVGASELIESNAYSLGGLTVTSGTTRFQGGGDIRIEDSFNGFRWYSMDGITQFGAFLVRSTENSWQDFNEGGRYIIHSDAGGIGIGTTATATGYDVSMPSLSVSGQTNVGLTRVSAVYDLSSTATCITYGNETCYYGNGTVSCPVGMRVLGGGVDASIPRYAQTSDTYPASTTSWNCDSSYDLINNTDVCYAICARLE